jgi:hypothetical protein
MAPDSENTLSLEQIDTILAFLPIFEHEDFAPSKIAAPLGVFPHYVLADELSHFQEALYENGFVFSFDWSSWQDEALRYFNEPELLHIANIQVLRKLLTLHVRKDRFSDGHLSEMVKCGHITFILRRLKELREGIV